MASKAKCACLRISCPFLPPKRTRNFGCRVSALAARPRCTLSRRRRSPLLSHARCSTRRRPTWPSEWYPRSAGATTLTPTLATNAHTAALSAPSPPPPLPPPPSPPPLVPPPASLLTLLTRQGRPARSRAEDRLRLSGGVEGRMAVPRRQQHSWRGRSRAACDPIRARCAALLDRRRPIKQALLMLREDTLLVHLRPAAVAVGQLDRQDRRRHVPAPGQAARRPRRAADGAERHV